MKNKLASIPLSGFGFDGHLDGVVWAEAEIDLRGAGMNLKHKGFILISVAMLWIGFAGWLPAEDFVLTQEVKVTTGQEEVTLASGQEVGVLGTSGDKAIIRVRLAGGNDGVFQVPTDAVKKKESQPEPVTAAAPTAATSGKSTPEEAVAPSNSIPQENSASASPASSPAPADTQGNTIQHGGFKKAFGGRLPRTPDRITFDASAYDMDKEQYYVHVPPNYTGNEAFGLLVFINAGDSMGLPGGWDKVLEQKKLLYIAPQNVGNNQQQNRRVDLSYIGLNKMLELYKVDARRVYVTGMSGGARTANWLALMHPDVISGALPICGADFYKMVPKVKATRDDPYGSIGGYTGFSLAKVKSKVRFALITGDKDWRLGNIQDIYEEGYKRERFQAKFIQVPEMGHEVCKAGPLLEGLEFIESKEL